MYSPKAAHTSYTGSLLLSDQVQNLHTPVTLTASPTLKEKTLYTAAKLKELGEKNVTVTKTETQVLDQYRLRPLFTLSVKISGTMAVV